MAVDADVAGTPMSVNFNHLRSFYAVASERSVTRAAEKLFLGQPAISAALSRLRILFDDLVAAACTLLVIALAVALPPLLGLD